LIVLLVSYPRSGNTFFRHVFECIYGYPTFTQYPEVSFGGILHSNAQWHGNTVLPLTLIKTHAYFDTLYKQSSSIRTVPVIYIVRDGRDAIVSHAQFQKKLGKPLAYAQLDISVLLRKLIIGELRDTNNLAWHWSRHVIRWFNQLKNAPSSIVHFEQLIKTPEETVKRAIREIGYENWNASLSGRILSFQELKEKFPTFFTSGQVGRYREEMSPTLQRLFWIYHEPGMIRAGYTQ